MIHKDDLQETIDAFQDYLGDIQRKTFFPNRYKAKDSNYKEVSWVTDRASDSELIGYVVAIGIIKIVH